MTDYNRNKVPPRPWEVKRCKHYPKSQIRLVEVKAHDGSWVCNTNSSLRYDEAAHIVHCVNVHDELVEALNEAINTICECCEHAAMTSEGDYICSKHIDGCGDILKLRPTLTKAKGGQSDDE